MATTGLGVSEVRALCRKGRLKEALHLIASPECCLPAADVYACLLQACADANALPEGRWVHAHLGGGLPPSLPLGNALVNMYSKLGSMVDARRVFDEMPRKNSFTWSRLIGGYSKHGQPETALLLFRCMEAEEKEGEEGEGEALKIDDEATFVNVLGACASVADLAQGKLVHGRVVTSASHSHISVNNALIRMYSGCSDLDSACRIFDTMPAKSIVSWNTMIGVYAQTGHGREALQVFAQMQLEGVNPDGFTFVNALSACVGDSALEQGIRVHECVIEAGFELDLFVGSALVNMYAKSGSFDNARLVFDKMPARNVVTWNGIISGCLHNGDAHAVLALFEDMISRGGVKPNKVTFVSVLGACAHLSSLEEGRKIHARVREVGYESDPFVGTALVDMYAKCGSMEEAWRVFSGMLAPDVVSWSALIGGYVVKGDTREALRLLEQMQGEGVKPNVVTFVSILISTSAFALGKLAHALAISVGSEVEVIAGNGIVEMYAKFGHVDCARRVFDAMQMRNVITWNVMMATYVRQGGAEEAFEVFEQMQRERVNLNHASFATILGACANTGALKQGKSIHELAVRVGCESDVVVGSALVNMYAKCGNIENARQVFDNMPTRNTITWNGVIGGYSQQGDAQEALNLFRQMQREGVGPNESTFVSVLSACSHAGLVDEGRRYFESMSQEYKIKPTDHHYACIVDLLGRAGRLIEAEKLINAMPFQPSLVMWKALLSACRTHEEAELAERILERVLELYPNDARAFASL